VDEGGLLAEVGLVTRWEIFCFSGVENWPKVRRRRGRVPLGGLPVERARLRRVEVCSESSWPRSRRRRVTVPLISGWARVWWAIFEKAVKRPSRNSLISRLPRAVV